jgi:hypothetical protein
MERLHLGCPAARVVVERKERPTKATVLWVSQLVRDNDVAGRVGRELVDEFLDRLERGDGRVFDDRQRLLVALDWREGGARAEWRSARAERQARYRGDELFVQMMALLSLDFEKRNALRLS